jgi:DNA invertase Pin-like site-specific DNA recombinase
MSFIDQLNQITAAKAKLAAQEQAIFQEREQALAKLPASHGYSDLKSFIKALKKATKPAKRTRAKITPELKQQVLAAIQEGKTGAEIVKAFGLSLPSVQNIKKEAGLVKVRASSQAAPAAQAAQEASAPPEGV